MIFESLFANQLAMTSNIIDDAKLQDLRVKASDEEQDVLDRVIPGQTKQLFYLTIRDATPEEQNARNSVLPKTLGESYVADTTMRHRVMAVHSVFDFEIDQVLANYVFERFTASQTPMPIFTEKQ